MDFSELQSKFPPEIITKIGNVIDLQEWIINATETSIDDVITKIKNSIFLEAKNLSILVESLISIAATRYDLNKILFSITTKLLEQDIDKTIKFKIKNKLAKYPFRTQFKNYQLSLFLRKLYNKKIIGIPSEKNMKKLGYKKYLFPEFCNSLPKKEDFLKYIGENCYPKDSPMHIVKEDNIDALMELASQPSFDVNTPIRTYSKDIISITLEISHMVEAALTLIDIAAIFGSVRCFKYLQVLGAKKTDATTNMAVWGGSLEIIRILDSDGEELHDGIECAACCFRNDIFDWLLDTKFDENNQKEITATFHSAAMTGNYYALMKLYNKAIQEEYTKGNMKTALQMAIQNNHSFMVEVLISASDYVRDMPKQSAPICHACRTESVKMVRMIHQKGADVNSVRAKNQSAFDIAMECKSLELLKYLIEKTNVRPQAHKYPFIHAIWTKDLAIIKYFTTTRFFNVKEQTRDGTTILHAAVSTDIPEIVEYIISLGADSMHEDSDQNTPYARSVIHGYKKSRKVLEAHDEIYKKMSNHQIRSMASKILNCTLLASSVRPNTTDDNAFQKLEKKIKKYGGTPEKILKGIELSWGEPSFSLKNWLSGMGLKIISQGRIHTIVSK